MNGRTTAALAALLAITTAFVGCLAPDELLSASERTEITAMESRDLADSAAQAWKPGASLGGVFTLELSEVETGDMAFPLDPDVGNGRSPVWIYAYRSADGAEARAFRVWADGRVAADNSTAYDASQASQLGAIANWQVDSDRAVAAVANDEVFKAALEGANLTLAMGVAQMDGITGWYLAALSEGGAAIAIVDASTGKVVSIKPFSMDFTPPAVAKPAFAQAMPTHVEGEGKLGPGDEPIEFPFTYGGVGDAVLEINAQHGPTDGLRWEILDAEGETVDAGGVGGFRSLMMGGSSSDAFEPEIDQAGAYTLVFSYRAGLGPVPAPGQGISFDFLLHAGGENPEEEDN